MFDGRISSSPTISCRRCGHELVPGRGELFAVSVVAVADPYPPVFDERDLAQDVGAEIRRLVAQLNGLDEQQARDQVYLRVVFHLCTACYEDWIEEPASH